MADLDYSPVQYRLAITVGDGSDQSADPDTIYCSGGEVLLMPLAAVSRVGEAIPRPVTISGQAISCPLDADGHIQRNDNTTVYVVDLGSTKVNPYFPTGPTHRIIHRNITAEVDGETVAVEFPEFTARISGTEVTDLTLVAPVDVVDGVAVLRGPRGYGVQSASTSGGNLTLLLENGITLLAGPLPVRPVDWPEITNKPATFPPAPHTHAVNQITGLQGALDAKLDDSQLGAPNGVAPLDSDGNLPIDRVPGYLEQGALDSAIASGARARFAAAQGALFVDPVNGNDNNDGLSPGVARKTASAALADVLAAGGGTLDLLPGEHAGELSIDSSTVLRSDLTIRGQQDRTILRPGVGQHGLRVRSSFTQSARRLSIDAIAVRGVPGSLDGFNFGDGSWEQNGHLDVRRFSVYNMGRDGIRIYNINNASFASGDVQDCAGRAIRATNNASDGTATPLGTVTLTAANDTLTKTAHGLVASQGITVAATANGLTAGFTYYVRTVLDANTFTLATSPGGTLVDITSDGTANATAYPKPTSGNTIHFDVVSTSNCAQGLILLDRVGNSYIWSGGEQNLAPTGKAAIEIIGAGGTGTISFRGVHMERNDIAARIGDGTALAVVNGVEFVSCYTSSTNGSANYILNRVRRIAFRSCLGSSLTGVPLVDSLHASDEYDIDPACHNGANPILRSVA